MTTVEEVRDPTVEAPVQRADSGLITWLVIAAFAAACFYFRGDYKWLIAYPDSFVVPFADWFNVMADWFVAVFKPLFRTLSWTLEWPMVWLRTLLHWLPWPATMAMVVVMAHAAAGWRLALFSALALAYMVVVGYWDESMNTLALVGVSVPLSVGGGFLIGLLGFKSRMARRIIDPTLDVMQTVPTFAYLVPIMLLFGFGPVVGLVASAVYAIPPMVRNVMLALSRVPNEIVESGQMSGCTNRQLLWTVQVPAAKKGIMMGVNQSIMAALSMVIIAAIIGGFADIGWEVLSTMRKAQTGQSLLAGAVIALMAMMMDRISRGFTEQSGEARVQIRTSFWQRHRHLFVALGLAVLFIAAAKLIEAFKSYPAAWIFYPAAAINQGVESFTVRYFDATETLKTWALYFFMLPIRLGLERVVIPRFWGFGMTPTVAAGYLVLIGALALAAWRSWNWRPAVGIVIGATVFFFGTMGTPWPVFILAVGALAYQVGGWRLGLFAVLGLLFILLAGVWERAMLTVYLASAAVFLSFVLGASLGILAATNDRFSAFIRPINDTLQTMPLFVFLIPVIMLFLVGEFSALLAIIMYAIVPSIRYTEFGLRNVNAEVIEAAESMGCTRNQILRQVKLPLALPEIMLGLNQTVMYGLAMLVITALIGTKGLGQLTLESVTKANFGTGVIAGGGMALIAMITDRIIQAWSNRKKQELGLA